MIAYNDAAATNADPETLEMLQSAVCAFLAEESPLDKVRALRGKAPDFDPDFWLKLANQGWLGTLVPEDLGGTALGFSAMRIVVEGLARRLRPEPVISSVVLAGSALLHGDNVPLRNRLLRSLVSGTITLGFACTEATGRLNVLQLPNTAVRQGPQGDELHGLKRFATPAHGAHGFIVSARDGEDLVLYWVPTSSEGVAVTPQPRADGTCSATLSLAAVPVTHDQIVARGERAKGVLTRSVDEALIMQSAELYGVMDAALSITLEYLKTRKQFGKAIGSFQALQHRAVDLYIQKELALGAVNDAVRVLDGGGDEKTRALFASRAKSRCADAALTITRESIKLHGAIGFADECDIGLYLQRALVSSAWLGNGAAHRRRIVDLIVDDPEPAPVKTQPNSLTKTAPRAAEPDHSDKSIDWNALTDEEFRTVVRDYFEKHYPKHLRYLNRRARWSETREWALRMSEKGWIAPAWPRDRGGMGLSPSKLIIYMEEQERWGVARAPDQGILMLGPLLMRFGTPEQQAKYLPKIISCEHIWCQGYSEPNAGSDLASLRTEARDDGDDYVVNGSKIWTTLAQDATHMFMLVRTDKGAKPQEGISFLLLDLKTPGVRVRPIRNIEGHEEFCEVFFDDVRIPKQNLVGELNKGWFIAKTLLGFERLNHGSPRRAQYPLRKVEMLARRLGVWRDPEFQSKYCRLRLDVEDLASAYGRYADIVRSGANPGAGISSLKIWATETFQRLTELLIEVAGEAGSLRGEIDFEGDLIDVLGPYYGVFTATIAAGSNEIQRNILAQRVLQLPR